MAQVAPPRRAEPGVIVLTGPECTGKSTLASELATRLDASLSLEFARLYVDRQGATLGPADVEPIARGQLAIEDQARHAGGVLVKDTDLVSTVVYARHYYGGCPLWIEEAARERLGDLYLLLAPDVPWMADGLQRDGPAHRAATYDLFVDTLRRWNASTVTIDGSWEERWRRAWAAVRPFDRR